MRCGGLTLPVERFPTSCREREFGDSKKRCWRALWRRWQGTPAEPLRVVGELLTGYIARLDEGMHLDAVLSAACFSLFASVVRPEERYVIPLPLALAWMAPDGSPLWLATELRPVGTALVGSAYLHSRYPTDRADLATRAAVLTSAGRHKDVRMPLAITAAARVEGWCIGDRRAVAELLDRVPYVGRKGAHGHGRVARWTVDPAPEIDAAAILARRNVPVEYLAAIGDRLDGAMLAARRGWTPPYWHPQSQGTVRLASWTR